MRMRVSVREVLCFSGQQYFYLYLSCVKYGMMMNKLFIGREKEQQLLNEYINSDQSEFIAVYGRRRVGKTLT